MDAELEKIKLDHFQELKSRKVVMLVESDYGWRVEQWSPDSVMPSSDYDTPQEAAARALQLLRLTDPVTPQNWPEVAQIGGERSAPPRTPPPR